MIEWADLKFPPINLWSIWPTAYHCRLHALQQDPTLWSKELMGYDLEDLIAMTTLWHHNRNLINGSTDKDQYMKLIQECGELSDNICKGRDIKDDIGDILVVLINIAARNKVSLQDCLQVAYDDIKHRKGRMVDGVFVKEADE